MRGIKCRNCDEVNEVRFDAYIFGDEVAGVLIHVDLSEDSVEEVDSENFNPSRVDKAYFENLVNRDELIQRFVEYWHENECYDMGLVCDKCDSKITHESGI